MTTKITEKMCFSPAFNYVDDGIEHGVLSPFETKEIMLEKGQQIADGFKPLTSSIKMLKDVPVKMRDGVTIYMDIFLPVTEEKVPVLIAWSPYGKSAGTAPRYKNLFNMLGMGNHWNSGLTKFEAPDPAYWCAHGYAVCNPDMRGIAHSEGDTTMIGSQEAEDGYDLIEWLAAQSWSNGKTALTGTSYLAFSQWYIAAEQPPHLTCINPTEGLADGYRDLAFIGGIPDPNFIERLQVNQHTVHEKEVIKTDVVDISAITSFVSNFAEEYHTWEPKKEALDKRTNHLKNYLTEELSLLNTDTIRSDIPTKASVEKVQVWKIKAIDHQNYQVLFSITQMIEETTDRKVVLKTVSSAFNVVAHIDEKNNLVSTQNTTISSIPKKSSFEPKILENDGTVTNSEIESIEKFLTTFFKIYPSANISELSYYAKDSTVQSINKNYVFSELINPIIRKKTNSLLFIFL